MLQRYTLHYLGDGKIEVDLVEPLSEGDYIYSQFVKHFKKYKPLIFKGENKKIRGVICDWKEFGEFLLILGFRKNAEMMCSILTELRIVMTDEYVEKIWGKGAILKSELNQPKSGKSNWTKKERIHLENMELKRRLENNKKTGGCLG